MKEKAVEYFNNGYSCSESVVKAAADEGFCTDEFLASAAAFSGGMSRGCLCGAVAGAQMVIGVNFTREVVREKAAQLLDEFTRLHKVTCCRALTRGLEGAQRKEHCSKMVSACAQILENLVMVKV
jgi:C_GCAxxG_C_C family probable redox protein